MGDARFHAQTRVDCTMGRPMGRPRIANLSLTMVRIANLSLTGGSRKLGVAGRGVGPRVGRADRMADHDGHAVVPAASVYHHSPGRSQRTAKYQIGP